MVKIKKSSQNKLFKLSRDGTDRIRNLPDSLISKILSLLPTENAVATSILSRRWRFLWTSITTLNFVEERPKKSVTIKKTKFTAFVNRVIMLITPPCIHKFCLNSPLALVDPIHFEMWISVVAQTVQELDIEIFRLNGNFLKLQMNHFRFNKLVILELQGNINFIIPSQASVCFPNLHTLYLSEIKFAIAIDSSVSFPNLMIVHLYDVFYANEESFHKLLSSCPASLQELYVSKISSHLSISTPSLTRLQLVVVSLSNFIDFKIPAKSFVCFPYLQQLHLFDITFFIPNDSSVCFPNLKILHITCYVGNQTNGESVQKLISSCPVLHHLYILFYTWKDLSCLIIRIPSLTKLQLTCWLSRDQAFEIQIDDLHKFQFLSISGRTLKAIWTAFTNNKISSDLYNLRRLELDVDDCWELSFVINNLLERMDNLEYLAIRMKYRSCSCAHKSWSTPLNVPTGLAWHVTTISASQISDGCNYQLEFLRYSLKNVRVLKELQVNFYGSEKNNQLVKKVSKFPKESRACQVKFVSY